ncbi:MAG: hypothetical protein U0270_06040 [Labilithrix sp.]
MSLASDDDEDLLVLADELQLKGDPRGELIGIQVELERSRLDSSSRLDRTRSVALRRRERELIAQQGAALADLEGLGSDHVFRRGFVDELTIDVRTFASRERELWRRAPRLRRLRFTGLTHRARMTGNAPDPSDAREVCYWFDRILASGRVTNLQAIDPIVKWSRLGPYVDHEAYASDAVVDWLIASNAIERLVGLELPAVAPETLWKLRRCARLEDLRLQIDGFRPILGDDFGDLRPRRLALTTMAAGPGPGEIPRVLGTNLSANLVDLRVPILPHVLPIASRLKILRGAPGDLEVIANAPELAGLEELELHVAEDCDYEPLLEPKHLDSLRVLRIVGDIEGDDALALLESPLASRIEALDLREPAKPVLAGQLASVSWDGCLHV